MLELQKVAKTYPLSKTVVLNEISFKIDRTEYCALIGNNGCGKTTVIKILCNLIGYDSGNVSINNTTLTEGFVSYKEHWGIVLSKPYYIEDFTISQYLTFVAKFQNVSKDVINARINDLVTTLELTKHVNQKIKTLSSGNQMKVSIAAALIHNPELLILDEPFVNLDINSTHSILRLLDSFRNTKTILITSHNLDLVVELCDRFLIMDKGIIVKDLRKVDYPSEHELKEEVKLILTKGSEDSNIQQWLR